jgi:uncharacterized protein with FMN-binding domain
LSFVTKRVLTLVACSLVLAVPTANAWATVFQKAAQKRVVVVTTTITGSRVECPPAPAHNYGKWGPLQLQIKISKVVGSKKFKILDVKWPVWPQHTARSTFINEKALPLLRMEVLQLQSAKIESISGATNITDSFTQSLQVALAAAAKK